MCYIYSHNMWLNNFCSQIISYNMEKYIFKKSIKKFIYIAYLLQQWHNSKIIIVPFIEKECKDIEIKKEYILEKNTLFFMISFLWSLILKLHFSIKLQYFNNSKCWNSLSRELCFVSDIVVVKKAQNKKKCVSLF